MGAFDSPSPKAPDFELGGRHSLISRLTLSLEAFSWESIVSRKASLSKAVRLRLGVKLAQ
jgi:hypothetical protein